ncbi:HIT domain protein [Phycisphaerae bacterium RAS1]|nr:HIT domain protein [Phycisphaerae bacterium RAS1]
MEHAPVFDEAKWTGLIDGTGCPMCRANDAATADDPALVAACPSGRILLQDDAAFRGYCILVFPRHLTELFELSILERKQFMKDVTALAAAVHAVCRPAKLNYAILGNEVPHLHGHVIPRYADDGWWGRPIWARPKEARLPLPPEQFHSLRDLLREALRSTRGA